VLYAGRYRGPWVVMCATPGNGGNKGFKYAAGEVFNTRVDSHTVVQLRIELNFCFRVGLKFGPTKVRAFGGYWRAERHILSMNIGWWSERCAEHKARCTEEESPLVIMMFKTSEKRELYGLVVSVSGPNIRQVLVGIMTQEFPPPSSLLTRSSNRHF
jgi:hypothetical protein